MIPCESVAMTRGEDLSRCQSKSRGIMGYHVVSRAADNYHIARYFTQSSPMWRWKTEHGCRHVVGAAL